MANMESPFGRLRQSNTVFRADGVEARADEFETAWQRHAGLSDDLPEDVVEGLDMYPFVVGEAVGRWHMELTGAAGMILNHATNDLLLLLRSVRAGDGRTAARTARVMFEHLVHYKEIDGQPAAAKRYEDHQHVTAIQIAERRIGLHLLKGPAARKERDRLKRLRRQSEAKMAAAVAAYGPRFRSGWTAGPSLFDLARAHGLDADYDAYRILSGVMHGSSGSLMGTRRTKGVVVTHRLGPDFQLVPVAFLEGMQWWRKLLTDLPLVSGPSDIQEDLETGADWLISVYPDIHATCQRVDNRTWPKHEFKPRNVAVMAVYPSGATRWFSHDVAAQAICVAELVGDEPDYVEMTRERFRPQAALLPGGRPLTVHLVGVKVRPRPGAVYVPSASVLNSEEVHAHQQMRGSE